MMDFSIVMFDDYFNVMQEINDRLAALKIADPAVESPWRVTLGDCVLNVTCKIITSKAQLEKQFAPGNFGSDVLSADLILLDNDWGSIDDTLGLKVLGRSGWRRGKGAVLAIYTAANTYKPEFVKQALDAGADALIYKNETTHLLNVLLQAVERKTLAVEHQRLLSKWLETGNALVEADPGLASKSAAMQRLLAEGARIAARKNEPALILGGIGTGKSRLARAMHLASPRAKARFKPINPGQIGDSLLQAELFGVARGAFTGAVPHLGLIEVADGGTVFIDDVENMSSAMQNAIMNVIETKTYIRPGDPHERPIDVRFIFATNANLEELGDRKEFRSDLRSRMEASILHMPSLADRSEDIGDLAGSFAQEFYADEYPGVAPPQITPDALEALLQASFSDNVRGLSNAIRRSLVQLPPGQDLDAAHLVLSKPRTDAEVAIKREDIHALLDVAPRSGPQRVVFERLIEKLPAVVPYRELNEIVGSPGEKTASDALVLAVSRLREKLKIGHFSIRPDKEQRGYALVKVIENA